MLKTELSFEELAFESVELLPDRDTMQPIIGSFASNTAYVTQTATSGAVSDVTVVGDAYVTSEASNYADVYQSAASGDVSGVIVVTP